MKITNKVIYQIYPKSFMDSNDDGIGDILGIISKLDYLKELGVDYLWLSPVQKSPQNDNGYDISDYYQIDEIFGSLDDYKLLINEAKKREMKVMIDLVLNHSSTEHPWFQKALAGDKYYQDFYIFRKEKTDLKSVFLGPAWHYVPSLKMYYLAMFDKTQADFNYLNENLLNEMIKMINYWLEIGVEGFRLDVVDMIGKDLEKGIISRSADFYKVFKKLQNQTFKKDYLTVGECFHASKEDALNLCSPDHLSEIFHFENLNICSKNNDKWDYQEKDLKSLLKTFKKWQNDDELIDTLVFSNHDNPRIISRWFDANLDNHKILQKLVLMTYTLFSGNLYIYQGDEIGMINQSYQDINEFNDVETFNKYNDLLEKGYSKEEALAIVKIVSRDNSRTPMPFNDELNGGFSNVKPWLDVHKDYLDINVSKDLKSVDSVYKFYQKVIQFRKSNYDKFKDLSIELVDEVFIIENANYLGYLNYGDQEVEVSDFKGEVIFNNYQSLTRNKLLKYQGLIIEK